jgi:hypothetical protein
MSIRGRKRTGVDGDVGRPLVAFHCEQRAASGERMAFRLPVDFREAELKFGRCEGTRVI